MELENFFPYELAVAAARMSRQLEAVYSKDGGLSREEWRVLFLLAGVTELTSKELSRRSSLDKVQISRAAKRLEEKGHIVGTESKIDRRLRDYACTDQGKAFFQSLFPKVNSKAEMVFGLMDPDDLDALRRGVNGLTKATEDLGL